MQSPRRQYLRGLYFPIYYQPFKPELAIPSTRYFWNDTNKIHAGTIDSVAMANIAPKSDDVEGSLNNFSAILAVYISGLFRYRNGPIKSSQRQMKEKIADVQRTGTHKGSMMCVKMPNLLHPSITVSYTHLTLPTISRV